MKRSAHPTIRPAPTPLLTAQDTDTLLNHILAILYLQVQADPENLHRILRFLSHLEYPLVTCSRAIRPKPGVTRGQASEAGSWARTEICSVDVRDKMFRQMCSRVVQPVPSDHGRKALLHQPSGFHQGLGTVLAGARAQQVGVVGLSGWSGWSVWGIKSTLNLN